MPPKTLQPQLRKSRNYKRGGGNEERLRGPNTSFRGVEDSQRGTKARVNKG